VNELRILLLEDNINDAELIQYHLHKEELSFSLRRVETEESFKRVLAEFKPDIILSDYSLPMYSGYDALLYVQKTFPEIPVIMVSGAIGEEKAVELLRLGARDYILKDRLGRLSVAILRVLQEDREEKIRLDYERQLFQSEERIRIILNTAPDAVISIDSNGITTSWNTEAETLFGYKCDEVIGKSIVDLIVPVAQRQAFEAGLKRFRKTGKSRLIGRRLELTALRRDQAEFSVELSVTAVRRGGDFFLNAFIRDITQRKMAEDSLRSSEMRHRLLVENSPMCIQEINLQGKIISMNRAGLEMLGLNSESEAIGLYYLDAVHPEDLPRIRSLMENAFCGESSQFEFKSSARQYQVFKSCFVPIKSSRGAVEKLMGITEDVTRRKIDEQKLKDSESHFRQLADFDELTGLPNRRLLIDRMRQAMIASKRSGHYGALMFLDLDNFKPLNDTYGHSAGDLLLVEAACRINSCVREIDTVSRFGGDEFIVMLIELDKNKQVAKNVAGAIAEKIRNKVAEPYRLSYKPKDKPEILIEHSCTSSIGVVMFLNHENSTEEILRWADIAMYDAKAAGRNKVCFYSRHAAVVS